MKRKLPLLARRARLQHLHDLVELLERILILRADRALALAARIEYLNNTVGTALAEDQPAISVDTKKKELVGDFKNAGRTWRPQGEPEAVRVHDFLIAELGKAIPYEAYDRREQRLGELGHRP